MTSLRRSSEPESQRHHRVAGLDLGTADYAETGIGLSSGRKVVAERRIRIARVEVVERVEALYPELQAPGFLELDLLGQ